MSNSEIAGLGRPRPGDGVSRSDDGRIRATFVLQGGASLAEAAGAVAIEESTGTSHHSEEVGECVGGAVEYVEIAGIGPLALRSPALERAGVTESEFGRATVSWPAENAVSLPGLLSLVTGETFETASFAACRLVGVELPDAVLAGLCGGPRRGLRGVRDALGVEARPVLGAIVKPSSGLGPDEYAEVAAALARGGADFVKDDEILTDPPHCRFRERVPAAVAALDSVAEETGQATAYMANLTGSIDGLLERAEFAVEAGVRLLMLNGLIMGLDAVRFLASADLAPVFAHRVFAGAISRAPEVGVAPGVLAGLTRVAGADCVQVGAIYGKLFEDDAVVLDNADNCTRQIPGISASLPVSGGGQSAATVLRNRAAFDGVDFGHLLGAAAVDDPAGAEAGVAKTVVAWSEALR